MLKYLLIVFAILLSIQASVFAGVEIFQMSQIQKQAQAAGKLSLPWVVGESVIYSVLLARNNFFLEFEVVSENDIGFWVNQIFKADSSDDNGALVEILFDKETGEVLEVIQNNRPVDNPAYIKADILEQKQSSVTVPSGTYNSIYQKTIFLKKYTAEVWVSSDVIPVFGIIKLLSPTSVNGLGEIVTELVSFKNL